MRSYFNKNTFAVVRSCECTCSSTLGVFISCACGEQVTLDSLCMLNAICNADLRSDAIASMAYMLFVRNIAKFCFPIIPSQWCNHTSAPAAAHWESLNGVSCLW